MTAPVWMAFPPEAHSALLSSGPGPGSLLAAAGAWNSLSAEYASLADELSAVLASVQAGAWEGPSAESYVVAHVPYLAWLMQASADSAAAAAQHETAAAAYSAALAAMPTLAELAANHTVHAVLVATNFFGINTIPIALNEADYVRMWVQAAATMSTYQVVSGTAVASTPQTAPTPQIVKTTGPTAVQAATQGQSDPSTGLGTLLGDLLQKLGVSQQFIDAYGIDNIEDFLNNPVSYTMTHAIHRLLTDPLALLVNPLYLFFDGDEAFFPLGYAFLPSVSASLAIVPVGSVAGVAAVAATAATAAVPVQPQPGIAPALAPVAAAPAPDVLPAVMAGNALGAPAAAPGTAPAPATVHATVSATAANGPTPPAPGGGAGFSYPYVVAPPGVGFTSGLRTGASVSSRSKAPEPDISVAAAAAAARGQARARRRRRAVSRGYGDEFMDMNVEVDPDWGTPPDPEPVASTMATDQGAGPLGFAGTVRDEAIEEAAGLTTLAGDEFGGGPRVPMMPGSWEPDGHQ